MADRGFGPSSSPAHVGGRTAPLPTGVVAVAIPSPKKSVYSDSQTLAGSDPAGTLAAEANLPGSEAGDAVLQFESWKMVDGSLVFWEISHDHQAKPLLWRGEQILCQAPLSVPAAEAGGSAPQMLGLCKLLELPRDSCPAHGGWIRKVIYWVRLSPQQSLVGGCIQVPLQSTLHRQRLPPLLLPCLILLEIFSSPLVSTALFPPATRDLA